MFPSRKPLSGWNEGEKEWRGVFGIGLFSGSDAGRDGGGVNGNVKQMPILLERAPRPFHSLVEISGHGIL